MWTLLPGYQSSETGTYKYPVAVIVANLAKETRERPALMTHFDATQLFHEIGHLFHELLSRTRYSRFHGTKWVLHGLQLER
jgi:Zn-dependent oligopeptidase